MWYTSGTFFFISKIDGASNFLIFSFGWKSFVFWCMVFCIFSGKLKIFEIYRLHKLQSVSKLAYISHIRILRNGLRLLMMCTQEAHHVLRQIKHFLVKFHIVNYGFQSNFKLCCNVNYCNMICRNNITTAWTSLFCNNIYKIVIKRFYKKTDCHKKLE